MERKNNMDALLLDKEWLQRKYTKEKCSVDDIANLLKCSTHSVRDAISHHNILVHSNRENDVIKPLYPKKHNEMKTIIMWLCGLWSLGLGFRMSLELLLSDGWIHVPQHPLNIYFDFIPLCVFGLITVWFQTKELFKVVQKKGWVDATE